MVILNVLRLTTFANVIYILQNQLHFKAKLAVCDIYQTIKLHQLVRY